MPVRTTPKRPVASSFSPRSSSRRSIRSPRRPSVSPGSPASSAIRASSWAVADWCLGTCPMVVRNVHGRSESLPHGAGATAASGLGALLAGANAGAQRARERMKARNATCLLIRGSQVRILPGAPTKPPETGASPCLKGLHSCAGGNVGGNRQTLGPNRSSPATPSRASPQRVQAPTNYKAEAGPPERR